MSGAGDDGVVLVHDYLLVLRGAERTFAAMADEWPDAPVATLLYDERGTQGAFRGRSLRTSGLQRLPVGQDGFRRLLPLFPGAARRLPVRGFATVVSSSSAFAHGVRPDPGARHVCYCHSPFRYAWHEQRAALAELPGALRPALRLALARHRRFDRAAAARVTRFVANSALTRERIRRFWGRDAVVVHPPVEVDRFRPGPREDFVLFVGEVVSHKRVELALTAAARAGVELVVVGTGPERARLEAAAGGRARFLGRVGDEELARLYAAARALVVPNVEEFGIAAVEAQAAGTPVVAADAGGARETVVEGVTGWRVPPGDVAALAAGLRRARDAELDPEAIRAHARQFSPEAFRARLREVVEATRAPS